MEMAREHVFVRRSYWFMLGSLVALAFTSGACTSRPWHASNAPSAPVQEPVAAAPEPVAEPAPAPVEEAPVDDGAAAAPADAPAAPEAAP